MRVLLWVIVLVLALSAPANAPAQVELWLTNPDGSALFQKQQPDLQFSRNSNGHQTVGVDETKTYQTIDGFGFTLTGGSAQHLIRMAPGARAALLRELFGLEGAEIGISYLRVSIGASDLNDHVFSYDDLPAGQSDPELKQFSLGPDRADVIPMLKEILAINPALRILGSPWSAPVWMKTNHDSRGGGLRRECYDVYARYFVKYLQSMKAEGISIDAITVQNEPLHAGNNPSMFMAASDQAEFIRNHLGPAFQAAGLDTKIILFDHNCDRPDYPISILGDAETRKFVDGSAFHMYAGRIEALTQVHEAHPDKNVYFTEQWIGAPGHLRGDLAWHIRTLIVGATRNWSRTVLEWNLASDPRYEPHTDRGGCDRCLGAITVDGNQVSRNPAYYIIAHAAKFVRPGSVRIASNELETLPNVAFKTSAGKIVVIILNHSRSAQSFNVRYGAKGFAAKLDDGAVGTYVW